MKKTTIMAILLFSSLANAQITKGNWMVGGSGGFISYKNTYPDHNTTTTQTGHAFDLLPNVGYFVVDNFSIGTIVNFSFINPSGSDNNSLSYGLAPFLRYYFRKSDKIINPFFQASYSFNRSKIQLESDYTKSSEYRLKGGSAFFLNSSVALEITIEYKSSISNYNNFKYDNFTTGIGFQIHLEKK